MTPRCQEAWAPCFEETETSLPSYSLFHANYNILTPAASSPSSSRPATPLSDDNQDHDPAFTEIDLLSTIDSEAWDPAWSELDMINLGQVKFPNLITINTEYDPQLEGNRIYACPRKDSVRNFRYTSRERERAARAYEPSTIQDLRNKASI